MSALSFKWEPAAQAPDDAWPMALAVRITCDCAKGGMVVLTGARVKGEWLVEPFAHTYEIIEFFLMPEPTRPGRPH